MNRNVLPDHRLGKKNCRTEIIFFQNNLAIKIDLVSTFRSLNVGTFSIQSLNILLCIELSVDKKKCRGGMQCSIVRMQIRLQSVCVPFQALGANYVTFRHASDTHGIPLCIYL